MNLDELRFDPVGKQFRFFHRLHLPDLQATTFPGIAVIHLCSGLVRRDGKIKPLGGHLVEPVGMR
jgi:hypothetical protein